MAKGNEIGATVHVNFYKVDMSCVSAIGIMPVAPCRVSMLVTPSRACSALTPQFDFVDNIQPVSLKFRGYALGLSGHSSYHLHALKNDAQFESILSCY